MNNKLRKLENSYKKITNYIFNILVPPCFLIQRWLKDKVFLVSLNNRKLFPGYIAYPVWFIYSVVKYTKNLWGKTYIDYGLKCYSEWIKEHYSSSGRGYYNYENLLEAEKISLYGNPRGRVEYFLKNNIRTLKYEDTNTFLDVGCGRGQNIKVLTEYFPSSNIKAFDVSANVLEIINLSVGNKKTIQTELGSITDLDYLKCYPSNGIDHVLVSHVFTFIMSSNESETILLRQQIIDELVRISNKTLLILGGNELLNMGETKFIIEQMNRAFYKEPITQYFTKYLKYGEIQILISPESNGVLYSAYEY